jgi:hypothetical protein
VCLHSYVLVSAIFLIRVGSDERLLAAARSDSEDLLLEIFEQGNFDINCQDGCVLVCSVLHAKAHPTLWETV